MNRKLLIGALLLPAILFGEELSDTDVESIVLLANGLAMGEIISFIEMEKCTVSDECSSYRNVAVTTRKADGRYGYFRASKIGDAWQLDEKEWERIEYRRRILERIREFKSESPEDAA